MREAIGIYGDKEYITQVNSKYVFFKFPDGNQDRLRANKSDLKDVYEWYIGEMNFYRRMHDELSESYRRQYDSFEKIRHYYSEEEIDEARRKHNFSYIPMEISNENYTRDINRIFGISEESSRILDKYYKYYRIARQIEEAYKQL